MPAHKLPFKEFEWTPGMAYIVGLLVTDGNLSKDGRHIAFRSSDLSQVETFKECLALSNTITTTYHNGWSNNPSYIIQFGNIQLYNWFLNIGLSPTKTYTIGELKIPDEYFKDFLRGHLDGDGSVSTYQDRWNTFKNPKYVYTRLWLRFISASQKHIEWLQKRIYELHGTKGHLWKREPWQPHQTTGMYEVKFGKKESIKLLKWIYYAPDIPCLKRKRAIAENFIN